VESGRAENAARSTKPVKLIIAGAVVVVLVVGWFASRPMRQRAQARHDVRELVLALDIFLHEQGEYPPGNLAQICRLLRGENVDGKNPRRLEIVEAKAYEVNAADEFVDPWGTAYRIVMTPSVRVYSCGPNRTDEQGAGDDIVATP